MIKKPIKWHRRSLMFLGVELMMEKYGTIKQLKSTDEEMFWILFDEIDFELLNKLALETHDFKDQSSREDLLKDTTFMTLMQDIFYNRNVRWPRTAQILFLDTQVLKIRKK